MDFLEDQARRVNLEHPDSDLLVGMELQEPPDLKVFLAPLVSPGHQVRMEHQEHQALHRVQLDLLVHQVIMDLLAYPDLKDFLDRLVSLDTLDYLELKV